MRTVSALFISDILKYSRRVGSFTQSGLSTRMIVVRANHIQRYDTRYVGGSMADHPRTRGRKAFRATPGPLHETRRLGRTAPAARPMRRLVFAESFRRVSAALVDGVGLAPVRGHAKEIWRRQNRARRLTLALRAVLRRVAFRHRPHVRERTAIVAEIIVERHFMSSRYLPSHYSQRRCGGGKRAPSRTRRVGTICPARAIRRHRP